MPCDTVTTYTVEFSEKTDAALLTKALAALGESPVVQGTNIRFNTGSYNTSSHVLSTQDPMLEAAIKGAYTRQVVMAQAARHGWRMVKPQQTTLREQW